jgi:hypothetical protein
VRAFSERCFVITGYTVALLLPLLTLVFFDPDGSCFYNCDEAVHGRSLFAIFPNEEAAAALRIAFRIIGFGVLGGIFILLALRKLLEAGAAGRRLMAPLLIASFAAATRAVSEAIIGVSDHSELTRQVLFWWQMASPGLRLHALPPSPRPWERHQGLVGRLRAPVRRRGCPLISSG